MDSEHGQADWYVDPTGKFEHRYWDGERWTDQVSEEGSATTDLSFDPTADWSPPVTGGMVEAPLGAEDEGPTPRSRKRVLIPLALLVVLIAGAAVFALTRGDDKKVTTATAVDAPTSSSTTSTTERASTTSTTVQAKDVVGLNLADATSKLRLSGKTVTVKEVIDTTKADGTVLEAAPTASSPNDVTVTVARGPVVRYLDSVLALDNQPSWRTVDVSGTPHPHSTSSSMGAYSGCGSSIIEYDLGRDYRRLQVLTGLTDASDTDLRVRFDLFVDGSPAGTVDSGFGEEHPLDIDVTGALRLKLTMSYLSGGSTSYNCSGAGVWADAKLLGVPSEVPPEGASSSSAN